MKRKLILFLTGLMLTSSIGMNVMADELDADSVFIEEYTEDLENENLEQQTIDDEQDEAIVTGSNSDASKISNPRVIEESDDDTGNWKKVTWDCVWFGFYYKNDTNGDGVADTNDKMEPIKWRVLSVNGDDALLLAEDIIDGQMYDSNLCAIDDKNITWKGCTLRSYLNGYGASENIGAIDFSGENNSFINTAFTDDEKKAIILTELDNSYNGTSNGDANFDGGENTFDKIFLLSWPEASYRVTSSYGFCHETVYDKGKRAKVTPYAKNLGVHADTGTIYTGNGNWWLRTPDKNLYSAYRARIVSSVGEINYRIHDGTKANGIQGVRPALHLKTSSPLWTYAGYVTTEGENDEVEPTIKRQPRVDLNNGRFEYVINGKGYGVGCMIIKDDEGNVLPAGSSVKYYLSDETGEKLCEEPALVDNDGFIFIRTDKYDNTASVNAQPIHHTVNVRFVINVDGEDVELTNSKATFNITVNPLSFTESWGLTTEAALKIGGYLGYKDTLGPAKVALTLAEASASVDGSSTMSIKNQYADGKRNLELGREVSTNLGINGSLGLSGKAKVGKMAEIDFAVENFSAGAKVGDKLYTGLKLEDYDPTDDLTQMRMGGFILGDYAVSSGNVGAALLYSLLDEKYNNSFVNVYSNTVNSSVSKNVDLMSLSASFKDTQIGSGQLIKLEDNTKYSYGQKYDNSLNPSGKPIFVLDKEAYRDARFGMANLDITQRAGMSGLSICSNDEFLNTYSIESRDDSFDISMYKDHGWAVNDLVFMRTDHYMQFEGEEREKLLNAVPEWKEFANGNSLLLLDSAINDAMKDTYASDAKGKYTEKFKKTESINFINFGDMELFSFPVFGLLGVEGGASFRVAGIYTDEYDILNGVIEKGVVNGGGVTDMGNTGSLESFDEPGKNLKLGEAGAFKIIGESLAAIIDDAKSFVSEVKKTFDGIVNNGMCYVEGQINDMKNRLVSIATIAINGLKGDESIDPNLLSYTIYTYNNEMEALTGKAGDELKKTAVTLGSVYCISLYESDGKTQVNNFEDTPIKVTIGYTDEMLKAAGLSADDEKNIEIYRYDPVSCSYISVGGVLDDVKNSVTVENITKAGQYILAAQENEKEAEQEPEEELEPEEEPEKEPVATKKWLDKLTKVSDTEYVLNLATKEKFDLAELAKSKEDGKNYKIIYASKNDSKIAGMTSKGKITAKKPGTSIIKIKKGNVEYKVTVNVFNPVFKEKLYSMNVGETFTPDYDDCLLKPMFSISEKQKKYADINAENGSVVAKMKGSIILTAKVGEEKNLRSVKTKVVIYDPVIFAKGTNVKIGKTIKLSIKNGAKKTTWSVEKGTGSAEITPKGVLKGLSAGTVTVKAENNGKILSKEIVVE